MSDVAAAKAPVPAQQTSPSASSSPQKLKYADPRNLPSFPSSGLAADGAAASAAASLGWSSKKSIDPWKPAVDSAGHRAALLAVGSASAALKQQDPPKPSLPSQQTWGNSAATQAFHAKRPSAKSPTRSLRNSAVTRPPAIANRSLSLSKATESTATPAGHRSLVAARGAMSLRQHTRPSSSVGPKKSLATEGGISSNALNGATIAHRASILAKASPGEAGAVPYTSMSRAMYTSTPPVGIEMEEQKNEQKLHQSAVAMAKTMYKQQQRMLDQAGQAQAQTGGPETVEGTSIVNLQDAAYRQAQERLSKLQNEHIQTREYQAYYGNRGTPQRNFSLGNKLRLRSDMDPTDDFQRSQKIREQMSMFSTKLTEVDKEKRQKDREALLAAAQRNVKARLQNMDEAVYLETGRVNPSLLSEWEIKAQQTAQSRHETRTKNKGKLDIGGGKFISPEEVDAIAVKRVQPLLDDINEKAEAERERLAALKLEEEAKKAEIERQKARDREIKEINKKLKESEKQEQKAKKEAEKAAKAEQKRLDKEEKRKSTQGAAVADQDKETSPVDGNDQLEESGNDNGSAPVDDSPTAAAAAVESPSTGKLGSMQLRKTENSTSPTSKVKGWVKGRWSRGKSLIEHGNDKRRSFFGGATMNAPDKNASVISLGNRSSSMREVAMAGKDGDEGAATSPVTETGESGLKEAQKESRDVSPVSTPLADEVPTTDREETEADEPKSSKLTIEPPRPLEDMESRASYSPTRDSRFREMMDR